MMLLWQRIARWWREDFAQTHHRGCGGKWEIVGINWGFMESRMHFRCSKCQDEHSLLTEH